MPERRDRRSHKSQAPGSGHCPAFGGTLCIGRETQSVVLLSCQMAVTTSLTGA
jgi:hypothetical protein